MYFRKTKIQPTLKFIFNANIYRLIFRNMHHFLFAFHIGKIRACRFEGKAVIIWTSNFYAFCYIFTWFIFSF